MILLIDNYDSFTHNLYQAFAQFHPDVRVVRNDKITLDEIRALKPEGIVLSPGPGRPEQSGVCIDILEAIKNNTLGFKVPVLGVCLGHQAIAAVFGGKVIQADEIVHGKSDSIFHSRQGLYEKMPLPFQAGRYHSLIVDRDSLPDCLMIEAQSGSGVIMGMKHNTFPIYGVQFHPESILTPKGNDLLRTFVELCK